MIVFDLLGVQNRDHGERGIARYVQCLARALESNAPGWVDVFVVHPHLPIPKALEPLIATGRVVPIDRFERERPADGGTFIAGSLFEMDELGDVVIPPWARGPEWDLVAVLYDLIPLRFPERYLQIDSVRYRVKARSNLLASCDLLLAISEASAHDAIEFLGVSQSQLQVIGAGADESFTPPIETREHVVERLQRHQRLHDLQPGFVFFPTGIEPRKNNDRMLEAYSLLPRDLRRRHQLVLGCRVTDTDRLNLAAQAQRLGISETFLVPGFVSDEELVELYQAAELVVFPSTYEGFGLPVLEAQQCGAAVICADSSSLREVQTDPSARFDPLSVEAIRSAVERPLTDPTELERLRALPVADFSWQRAAELTIAAVDRRRRPAVRRRSRVAFITPLPPQQSGIATYAAHLLSELAEQVDVTAYVDADPADIAGLPGVRVRSLDRFDEDERLDGPYHRVVHQMGNSEYHLGALALLERRGGSVMLHEGRLTGLFHQCHELRPELLVDGSVGHTLAHWYPRRYRQAIEESEVIWPETADRFGILLARPVVEWADQVFVHSAYTADLIELDTGRRPTVAFPIPMWPTGGTPAGSSAPVISSFGIVAPVKQLDLLIEALALVIEQIPDATLRVVGSIDEPNTEALSSLAAESGVADRVSFTGAVDDQRWAEEMDRATVAVQLRAFSNGESSGAVAQLLARGRPVVTTAVGPANELPDDVVRRVGVDADAPTLARTLLDVLLDDDHREAMSAAASCYAEANSYAVAAAVLCDLLGL